MAKGKKRIAVTDWRIRSAATVDDITDTPVVKSAERVLRILEYFDDVQQEARVTEIASHLKLPQSSASALLQSLSHLGYLDYDRTQRTFLPTPRVAMLGSWLNESLMRNGRLLRMMEDISQQCHDTIILAVRNGIYSQYAHVIQATTPIRYHVPPASRRLMVWSGTGIALLMYSPDEEIRGLVARTNAEMSKENKPIASSAVLTSIRQARRDGHFLSRELVSPGAGALAMPLPAGIERRSRPMVICVSGVLERIEGRQRELVALLNDTIGRYLLAE